MAYVAVEILTRARPSVAWDAIRDVGALHTRLVPGFVTSTTLVDGGRRVTFANGATVEEPIVGCNDDLRRLCWTIRGDSLGLSHYNASARVFARVCGGSRVVWEVDLLPDTASATVLGMMQQGAAAMTRALDQVADAAAR
jgi:hypothetical protein